MGVIGPGPNWPGPTPNLYGFVYDFLYDYIWFYIDFVWFYPEFTNFIKIFVWFHTDFIWFYMIWYYFQCMPLVWPHMWPWYDSKCLLDMTPNLAWVWFQMWPIGPIYVIWSKVDFIWIWNGFCKILYGCYVLLHWFHVILFGFYTEFKWFYVDVVQFDIILHWFCIILSRI